MHEMREAAFTYRSLYLLCVRSIEMAMCLQASAGNRGDQLRAHALGCEVLELDGEAERWFVKWKQAGGHHHAPISAKLPLRRTDLTSPGVFDMSNVVMFPTPKEDIYAC